MSAVASEPLRCISHSLDDSASPGPLPRGRKSASPGSEDIHEVVACVDGSPLGSGVVPHAALLATCLGARLTLLRVLEVEESSLERPDSVDWAIRERAARGALMDLEAKLGGKNPELRSELIQGRAAEQIVSWLEHHDVAITVICSHGARGVTSFDLASTARKLADSVPGSLLMIPAEVAATGGSPHYSRILVPLDGSARAESVLPIATRVAAAQDAELVLVHVVVVPEITRAGPQDSEGLELERRVVDHNWRVASAYIDRIRARTRHASRRARVVVAKGGVRATLARLIAEEQADLLIMSTHGHTGCLEVPCGSVASHTLAHCKTPLLLVRQRERGAMKTVPPERARPLERHLAS